MKMLTSTTVVALATVACSVAPSPGFAQQPAGYVIVAQHLNAPRGLRFGPDGHLYVAEAGTGGPIPSANTKDCTVPTPPGPYTGGKTGRISKISPGGVVTWRLLAWQP